MKFSDDDLVVWADCLIEYAENWDEHFKRYGNFFTQEYWYLLMGVTRAYWDQDPLCVAAAEDQMVGLQGKDESVKKDRIKNAIKAGLIQEKKTFVQLSPKLQEKLKEQHDDADDARKRYLIPTPLLEKVLRLHLATTLGRAVEMLRGFTKK